MTDIATLAADGLGLSAASSLQFTAPATLKPPLLARARIALIYRWRHGRWPSVAAPRRFTEWVQWRKLYDHDPRQSHLQDKVAVKDWAAARLGAHWITPTLWHGTDLPDASPCAVPYVIKSRHGCNQRLFVRDDSLSWRTIRTAARQWLDGAYGYWLDEWLYRNIPRGVLIEPFIGTGRQLPVDYKLYVFGGRVEAIQLHLDREHAHRWILFDTDWLRLSQVGARVDDHPDLPHPPASLARMIAGAESLAAGFDFVRVDFYEIGGQPRFGEMTFYPGSGLDPFESDAVDLWLGGLWADSRRRGTTSPSLPVPTF